MLEGGRVVWSVGLSGDLACLWQSVRTKIADPKVGGGGVVEFRGQNCDPRKLFCEHVHAMRSGEERHHIHSLLLHPVLLENAEGFFHCGTSS